MSIADIGSEAAQASTSDETDGDGGSSSEYSRIQMSGGEFIRMHPGPTAIEFTVNGLRYSPPYSEDGEYDDSQRGETYVVIEDPTVPTDDSLDDVGIFESTTATGDDYRVVNTADDGIDVYQAGVSIGAMFESNQVDGFDLDGPGFLKLSSSAGRSVARTLDVCGLPNADVVRTEDGDPEIQDNGYPTTNEGLIEKHPRNNEDGFYEAPRYARDPQLRPDVDGARVIVLVQHMSNAVPDYEGNAHWSTVLADLDAERQDELAQTYADDTFYSGGDEPEDFIEEFDGTEFINLAPTADFSPDEELLYETQWLDWNYPDEDVIDQLADAQGVN